MGTLVIGFLIGCAFGAILYLSGATSYRRILGTLRLKDMWIIKLMATAIGVGTLGIYLLDEKSQTRCLVLDADDAQSWGRLVYLAADVDRCYGRRGLPDHGTLLAKAARWAAGEGIPLRVEGPGFIDCHLYRQEGRLILHLVNLSGCDAWPAYLEEHLPVGPLRVSVRLDGGWMPTSASSLPRRLRACGVGSWAGTRSRCVASSALRVRG